MKEVNWFAAMGVGDGVVGRVRGGVGLVRKEQNRRRV